MMGSWEWTLIDTSWKSFVIMATVWLAVRCWHGASAAIRHRLWLLGLCGTLLLPIAVWILPPQPLPLLPEPTSLQSEVTSLTAAEALLVQGGTTAMGFQAPDRSDADTRRDTDVGELVSETASDTQPPRDTYADFPVGTDSDFALSLPGSSPTLGPANVGASDGAILKTRTAARWWLALWSIIAAALLVRLAVGCVQTLRWVRHTAPLDDERFTKLMIELADRSGKSPIQLRQSADVLMPYATGIIRPTIVLPSDACRWSDQRIRLVLLHELAHIVRRDVLSQLIADVCSALYWFNPLVWKAAKGLRVEREKACDDWVLNAGVTSADYAQTLLEVARCYRDRRHMMTLAMACPNHVEQRILSVLDTAKSRFGMSRRAVVGAVLAVMLVTGITSSLRPVSRAQSPADADATLSTDEADAGPWFRGSLDELEIRLRGEIIGVDGKPAKNASLTATLDNGKGFRNPLEATITGSRFEAWVPVNRADWHRVDVNAASGETHATQWMIKNEIRQTALEGVQLQLERPTRFVDLRVEYRGGPVEDAHVIAVTTAARRIRGTTDASGIFRTGLLWDESLTSITVWTDDYKIGGFQFARTPVRDPDAASQTVELHDGRDQLIQMVDEQGDPVSDVEFQLLIATPSPHVNFLGVIEQSFMRTDARGEALFSWFPDWEDVHAYVELKSDNWVCDGDPDWIDGLMVIKLKKKIPRKRITGQVVWDAQVPAGFCVELNSFQGERDGRFDFVAAFTDLEGRFAADVLPDATYCVFVNDLRWVSEMIDLVPYNSSSGEMRGPVLNISAGVPVTVELTEGELRYPMAHEGVNFRTEHRYEWKEEGRTRGGSSARDFFLRTDGAGRVQAYVPEGTLSISVYMPDWRAAEEIEVSPGEAHHVEIHREIDRPREVRGRLIAADEVGVDFRDMTVMSGAVDGHTRGTVTVNADAEGNFSLESKARKIGLFAHSDDGQLSGMAIAEDVSKPISIALHPTVDYRGQLLDEQGEPVGGRQVRAIASLKDTVDPVDDGPFWPSFEVKRFETLTDVSGDYGFRLPTNVEISIHADADGPTQSEVRLGRLFLDPGEVPPLQVNRLGADSRAADQADLATRYTRLLRDCRLGDFRMMVICTDGSEDAETFIDDHLLDSSRTPEAMSFLPLRVPVGEKLNDQEIQLVRNRGWMEQEPGEVLVCVYDVVGDEVAKITLSMSASTSADVAADFLRETAPPQVDAQAKWEQAFEEARRTDRRVWVRISQRYCGPCFTLARWMDDQRELLEKEFVLLKIDNVRDLHGPEVMERLTHGRRVGIPFHGVFDADQKLLIDSRSPLGNIGSISGYEGKKHLRRMLTTSQQHLTDDEIAQIVTSVPGPN